MNETYFSIIVPVFNTNETFLKECFDSINGINYTNYEIIIIDDGSNKETKQFIDNYNFKNKNFKIIHQKNSGQFSSRINGIGLSTGDYLFFLDSDDIIADYALSHLNTIILNNEPDVIMFSLPRFINSTNKIVRNKHYFKDGFVKKEEVIEQIAYLHNCNICSKCSKRELLINNHLEIKYKYGEDLIQAAELTSKANTFFYTEKFLYFYRINEANKCYYPVNDVESVNYLIPVYNILFSNNTNKKVLSIFKNSAFNAVIYKAFTICFYILDKNERNNTLDKLYEQEIVKIIISIDSKLPIISNCFLVLFKNRKYNFIRFLSYIYKLLY